MSPKVETESLSKLKRKRGQFRHRAREAFVALKTRVEDLQSRDINAIEMWQIPILESEIQSVEVRVEAYADVHLEVQCASGDDPSISMCGFGIRPDLSREPHSD